MSKPELRALRVGEILDVSFKLYFRNALTMMKIVALVVIPAGIITFLIMLSAVGDVARVGELGIEVDPGAEASLFAGTGLAAIISVLATLLAVGAAFRAIADAYLGTTPDAGTSLRFAGTKLLSFFWLSVLMILLIFLGFLLLIIPGIYLAVAFSVAVPVLLVEDVRGRKALGRSRRLVSGRWWPTFGTLLLGYTLIPGVIGFIIEFGIQLLIITNIESVTAAFTVQSIAQTISAIITTPFQVAVLAVLYFDLRVRKEGFDLQLLAERIHPEIAEQRGESTPDAAAPGSQGPPAGV